MRTDEKQLSTLLDLVAGLFAVDELRSMRGSVYYDRQRSRDAASRADAMRAATHVSWTHAQDELDHHWQVRRIERMAPELRALVPSAVDDDGWADAHCSIEMTRGRVQILASRENGEETDSTLAIVHELVDGEWRHALEVSMAWDGPAVDLLALDGAAALDVVARHGWNVEGARALGHEVRDGDLVVRIPYGQLAIIAEGECA